MSFVQIIQDKLERAKHEFVTNSSNSLSNAGPLLVYIEALRSIYNMEVTERLDIDSNHNDLVSIKEGVVSKIDDSINGANTNTQIINTSLSTINSNIVAVNNRLDSLSSKLSTIITKLEESNEYLKTISNK